MCAKRSHRAHVPREPRLDLEAALWADGVAHVAGLDEAGRGAWAGPVVAAAVILSPEPAEMHRLLAGVRDSKQLSPARREALYPVIWQTAAAVGVGGAGPAEVDRDGLLPATRAAMERAIAALGVLPQHLLIDAVSLQAVVDLPQQVMFFGEARSLSIAAASVVAKVARDRLLQQFDRLHPGYGFARHKGYGTAAHRAALQRLGPTSIHRKSFRPVAAVLQRPGRPEHAACGPAGALRIV